MTALSWILSLSCALISGLLVARLCRRTVRARDLKRLDGLLEDVHTPASPLDETRPLMPDLLTRRLLRAGWEPQRKHAVIALAAWLALTVAAIAVGGLLTGLCAAALLPLAAWGFIEWRGNRNMARLGESMLGLLERIRQLLTVGNSLPVALHRAVENSPPVVAQALASTLRRINNGAGVADSIERAAAELDIYELHMLGTAARTNMRFGGAMGTILKNMIDTIRRRAAVERELRSNTTQIRASAWVLALLPMLVAGVVMSTNRTYSTWFLANPAGHTMILYAAISQGLGILVMRMIIRTRY